MGLTWSYATQCHYLQFLLPYFVSLCKPALGSMVLGHWGHPYAGVTEWMWEGRVSHMVNNCPDTVLPDCDIQRPYSNVVNLLEQVPMNHAVTKSVNHFFLWKNFGRHQMGISEW